MNPLLSVLIIKFKFNKINLNNYSILNRIQIWDPESHKDNKHCCAFKSLIFVSTEALLPWESGFLFSRTGFFSRSTCVLLQWPTGWLSQKLTKHAQTCLHAQPGSPASSKEVIKSHNKKEFIWSYLCLLAGGAIKIGRGKITYAESSTTNRTETELKIPWGLDTWSLYFMIAELANQPKTNMSYRDSCPGN